MSGPTNVMQIVISRLRDGADRDAFLALTREMVAWLSTQPGFVSYELYEGKEGWADRIEWASTGAAVEGNQAFATTDVFHKMMTIVDSDHRGLIGRRVDLKKAS
jgi:quinol monooxygenase YgiN